MVIGTLQARLLRTKQKLKRKKKLIGIIMTGFIMILRTRTFEKPKMKVKSTNYFPQIDLKERANAY